MDYGSISSLSSQIFLTCKKFKRKNPVEMLSGVLRKILVVKSYQMFKDVYKNNVEAF